MASSSIGSVFVNLGLDSAQFDAGLKRASGVLNKYGVQMTLGLETVVEGIGKVIGALPRAVKSSIDFSDTMSKAAQKVGVTTEALSRLNYAADYSDVSLEQLTGGLQKLTKNMADVASGQGATAAVALQALGISATDSTGKLREADAVFLDVADRFSRMEDGSTKTALAIQLFGRSGAELIPLLNEGADGLQRFADESDRTGNTITTKTGKAAEEFNDTLTRLQKALQGAVNKITEAALPALQSMADWIVGLSPEIVSWGTAMVGAAAGITALGVAASASAPALKALALSMSGIATAAAAIAAVPGGVAFLAGGIFLGSTSEVNKGEDAFVKEMNARFEAMKGIRDKLVNLTQPSADDLYSGFSFGADGQMKVQDSTFKPPNFGDSSGAGEAMARRLEALRESLRTEEESEKESFEKRKTEIQKFYDDGVIQRSEYDDLLLRAQEEHSDKMIDIAKKQADEEARIREQLVDNVAGIFGSLSTLAENMGEKGLAASKAFGVAEAVINTAQGITKALAQGGILGFAGAAAVAAAGAAQISTILSTQKGSGSQPSVRGGAGSVPSAVPAVAPAAAAPSQAVNVTIQGQSVGRDQLRDLLEQIGGALGDGMTLKVVN
jgi:hypothetical protein